MRLCANLHVFFDGHLSWHGAQALDHDWPTILVALHNVIVGMQVPKVVLQVGDRAGWLVLPYEL